MKVCAIVAEYNPLHNGHLHHINSVKKTADAIVVIMSGHIMQRGSLAIYDKWSRTQAALNCGADLVIELPTAFSCSSAERFAHSAIYLIKELKYINMINFGSESGDIDKLNDLAHICQKIDKTDAINHYLKKGYSYPKARQLAIGPSAKMLSLPNNTLGVEYIKACLNLNFKISLNTTKRLTNNKSNNFVSSSYIRANIDQLENYVPNKILSLYKSPSKFSLDLLFYILRNMTVSDFYNLPDVTEGLEHRLYKASKSASNINEFFELVKTKRYTMSRLRRISFYALLNMQKQHLPKLPQYARVLGFNKIGQEILSQSKKATNILVTSNFKNIAKNFPYSSNLDSKATDLFMFCQKNKKPCGLDYTKKPIINL